MRHRSEVLAHLLKWLQTGTKPPNLTDTHSSNEGSRAKERIDCQSTMHCGDAYASGDETYASGDETNASGDLDKKASSNDGQEQSNDGGKSGQNEKGGEEKESEEGSTDVQTKSKDNEKDHEGSAGMKPNGVGEANKEGENYKDEVAPEDKVTDKGKAPG